MVNNKERKNIILGLIGSLILSITFFIYEFAYVWSMKNSGAVSITHNRGEYSIYLVLVIYFSILLYQNITKKNNKKILNIILSIYLVMVTFICLLEKSYVMSLFFLALLIYIIKCEFFNKIPYSNKLILAFFLIMIVFNIYTGLTSIVSYVNSYYQYEGMLNLFYMIIIQLGISKILLSISYSFMLPFFYNYKNNE